VRVLAFSLWLSKLVVLIALGFTLALIGLSLGAVLASRAMPTPALERVPLQDYTTYCDSWVSALGTVRRDC
jgi:hypothetical protein